MDGKELWDLIAAAELQMNNCNTDSFETQDEDTQNAWNMAASQLDYKDEF